MSRRIFLIVAIVLTFVFVSNAQTRPRKMPPAPPKPAANGLIKTASGLSYIITKRGKGRTPKAGDIVVVNYTGTLMNGKKFDSSYDSGRAITFPLGKGRVIKGWDEGIAKMRTGDQAIFIIPSKIGYGANGNGPIPPNASMIFILELMDINPK
ncbi:MAG: FKBP-type peptidyl-prolyl cis-trans isomerase [Pyrinomonadaceae bacterium]